MRRFVFLIFFLLFIAVPAFADHTTCTPIMVGMYPTNTQANAACGLAFPQSDSCLWDGPGSSSHGLPYRVYGYVEVNGGAAYGSGVVDCSIHYASSQVNYRYLSLGGACPEGSVSIPEFGGACGCEQGVMNYQTQSCESDDGQPDDPPEQDDSDNTGEGGDGNDHGGEPGDTDGDGEPDDGSECNFAPEGCIPGDVGGGPPDLTDIDPPEPDEPIPPTATRTKEETTDNPDGSTTGKTTDSWTEGDGCKVTQTTSTTNNPDGSGNKNTTTTRRCPDGTTTSTTGKWEIDDQGNSTLTGSSSSKEIEGGDESKRSASGGADCLSAPKCSGDAIDCAIQLQVWLLRCDKNTEYADSPCTAQPKCDGDVLLCAGLINTWQDRCSMERAAFDTQKEFTDRGFQTAEQTAQSGGVFGAGQVEDISTMADGVFSARSSISGSCPSSINLSLPLIGSLDFSLQPLCDAASAIYWLVLLSAYVVAAFIIFRSVTEPV